MKSADHKRSRYKYFFRQQHRLGILLFHDTQYKKKCRCKHIS